MGSVVSQPRRNNFVTVLSIEDTLVIDGGRVVLTLEHKSGQRVRVRVDHDGTAEVVYVRPRAMEPEEGIACAK